ncbi:MAG: TRAP transporter small permease subunit [Burkholderiales bacterium]
MIKRLVDRLVLAGGVLAGVSTVLILALVCVEVAARMFNRSTMVADELAGYLNVGIVFFGLAYTVREGGFIRIELLYERLRGRWLAAVRWFIVATSLLFVLTLTFFISLHVQYAFVRDTRAISVLNTPEYIPMTIMVVGCVLLVLQLLMYLVDRVRTLP